MSNFIVLLVVASILQISQADIETIVESCDTESYSSSSSSSASSSSSYGEWSSSSSYQPPMEECGPPVIRQPKCTKPNEVLEICPARCPFRTCGIDDTLIDCAPSPVPGDADCPPPGCRCKPQFFRNDKGNCVPWKQCPICKNPNEIYDPCDASCPGRRCDVDPRLVKCKQPPQVGDPDCVAGCRCIDGYLRDCNGICIPKEKCPPLTPVCGPNEEYDPCPDCSLQTCETMNATYACPAMPANKTGPNCHPSCRCIEGYYRNKIGECIAASDCLKCTKPYEYFSCGGACDNVCENIKEQNQTSCPIINVKCNPMCYCEKDYARDYKNDCIPIKDCPTCPANERYDPCPANLCQPKTCDEAGFSLNCTQTDDGALCPGKPGCVCKNGYLRNKKGICIPTDQCPSCGGDKNATLGCGINCNRHCSNLNQTEPQLCILICYPNSCDCKTDKNGNKYYYDDNTKKCVLPQDCTKCKNPNEVYDECDAPCPGRRCDVDPRLVRCKPPPKVGDPECLVGCRCIDGYARDSNGVCIPREKCPPKIPKCGPNEEYDPCPDCSLQTCETMNATYHCPLIPANKTGPGCNPSCRCKKGYYRNKIGQCIAASDCLKCTKPHEYFSCGGACDNVCENIKEQNQTSCPIINVKCNPMCYCEKDYARDYKNDCIPIKDCPTCPANEKYDPCPATLCQPQTCDEAGFPLNCTQREDGASCPGKPGCVCKDGYLRNKKGICVPSNQCPSCGGDKNATLGCGVNCNRHCSNLNQKEPQGCILICNPNSCDCRTDKNGNKYYYDDNTKKCVLPQDCKQCKENEQYSDCPSAICRPQTCKQAGYPVPCPIPGPDGQCPGDPGCICISGYLRNDKGICIPDNECPSCGGDDNAIPGCGTNCGHTCATYNSTKPVPCPLICNLNGCDCKKKYVYDGNLRKCVLPEKCTPTCKVNEEFSTCVEGICRAQNCTDKDKSIPCPGLTEGSCTSGCVCKEHYLRAKNGTCVPEDQCDNKKCPANEQYTECPSSLCQPQTCKQAGFPISCSTTGPSGGQCPGKPGCICIPDYLRNDKGICIPKKDCPSCGGDENAIPGCGNHCGKSCATYNKPIPCPLFCNVNGCDCRDKYIYDDNLGKCVLPKNCTPTCQVNEEFTNCTNAVCPPRDCADKGKVVACPAVIEAYCTAGCVCKDNYLRANNGTCVPEDQCEPTCPDGEILSDCPPIKCDAEYCPKSRDDPQTCPTPKKCGPPRCVCGFNSHRDRKTGKCIATADCPPFPCDGQNEQYQSCPPVCPGENCTDYLNNATCPKFKIGIVVPCKPACRCIKGYYRNPNGICVSGKKCKDYACKVNEEYSTCANGLCRVQDCADKGKEIPCPVIEDGCCTTGCVCKKNYLRAKNGTCVPEDQCDNSGC